MMVIIMHQFLSMSVCVREGGTTRAVFSTLALTQSVVYFGRVLEWMANPGMYPMASSGVGGLRAYFPTHMTAAAAGSSGLSRLGTPPGSGLTSPVGGASTKHLLKSEDGLISSHLPHASHMTSHHLPHASPGSGGGGSGTTAVRSLSHGHTSQSSTSSSSCSNQSSSDRNKPNKPHIKKPLNAFMLYMKEMRAKVVAECTLKESAAINQILGRRWHALSREEQAKYYDMARKERELHLQLYPGWTARESYAAKAIKKKKKKDKSLDGGRGVVTGGRVVADVREEGTMRDVVRRRRVGDAVGGQRGCSWLVN
ncbi:unnamed protein product [Notodromas monacha]|uniref:dTCF n=1 Tax=Notodromas monacha TaxID=399045 RepID=A0A7R9GEK2_9CRUS|nr:unnamed protein product [Notodromas monacha]CAG0919824.1 unnamed protein product [Notodromas monacha]